MRVDDSYAWGGGELCGLYDPDSTRASVVEDFALFCKLAVANGVVLAGWDWDRTLGAAEGLLSFAFEKDDARSKYGGENVFTSISGKPSLRATAERIYGFSVVSCGGCASDPGANATLRRLRREVEGAFEPVRDHMGKPALHTGAHAPALVALLADVGGAPRWSALLRALKQPHTSY
eukprot:TRINITY_DN1887_c0_g2_i11.p2 TRINITY_DN1887_c0_g2~~TRINITY_DN1887_c0_g2_i11.p2  ORF type:complete len:177 (+),score=45.22 TRINITY_DN1887_c0_g2_i11:377-907(+)